MTNKELKVPLQPPDTFTRCGDVNGSAPLIILSDSLTSCLFNSSSCILHPLQRECQSGLSTTIHYPVHLKSEIKGRGEPNNQISSEVAPTEKYLEREFPRSYIDIYILH